MKNVVIIAGSSNIGLGIIKDLLDRDYMVYSTYNSKEPSYKHKNLAWFKLDLSSTENLYDFVQHDIIKGLEIDVLIYNAGLTCRKSLKDVTDDDILSVFNVNILSCYRLIRELLSKFTNDAKIIVTGSQMGIHPHSVSSLYGMSKECLHSMVKNLVKEFDGTNITINAIVPGFVDTDWQKSKPDYIRQNICNKTELHRFATVNEIVKGYMFCVDNPYVNGCLLEINGGYNYK